MANAARDIALDANGELLFTDGDLQMVAGSDAIVSDARARLQFIQGEWFLDLSVGVPYYQSIFVKNPNMAVVQAAYRDTLAQTEGVISVDSLTVDYDSPSRNLKIAFSLSTDVGVINQSVAIPVVA